MKTFYLFPMSDDNEPPTKSERGISILIAITSIAVMMGLVADLILSNNVAFEMTNKLKDRRQASYMAKSGLNLAIYMTSAHYLLEHLFASGTLGMKQEPVDGPGSLWSLFNKLPPLGADTLRLTKEFNEGLQDEEKKVEDPFGLKGLINAEAAAQMDLLRDEIRINIQPDTGINISDCVGGVRACKEVLRQLENLFSGPAESILLEEANLTPKELAYRIKDFISSSENSSPESRINKDGPYERFGYKAKRGPLFSVSELNLIEGWSSDFDAVFSPYITVYPYRASGSTSEKVHLLNINTTPRELLASLYPESQEYGCRENFHQMYAKSIGQGSNLVSTKGEMSAQVNKLLCVTGDKKNVAKQFTKRSDIFRLQINSRTGKEKFRITAVLKRTDKGDKSPWLRKRKTKRSYQILYWKIG